MAKLDYFLLITLKPRSVYNVMKSLLLELSALPASSKRGWLDQGKNCKFEEM